MLRMFWPLGHIVIFDKNYWLNFFELGKPTTSYLLKYNKIVVGHSALQFKKDNKSLWLCWVLIEKNGRGKGHAQKLLEQTEERVKSEFQVREYYLNVKKNSTSSRIYINGNG